MSRVCERRTFEVPVERKALDRVRASPIPRSSRSASGGPVIDPSTPRFLHSRDRLRLPPVPLDLIAELEALVASMDREGVEYALCGGLALGLHGYPRATMDIDVLVRPEQLADAIRVARDNGFDVPARKMVFGLRTGTPREVQRVSKLDPPSNDLLALDLLVVNADLEAVWRDRSAFDVGGHRIFVVSRDGLATMKRIAGRPQDLVDLAKLEGRNEDDDTSQ